MTRRLLIRTDGAARDNPGPASAGAVLIDAEGIIRAKGLVNTREHLESLFEAKERGVASLQEHLARERTSRHVA